MSDMGEGTCAACGCPLGGIDIRIDVGGEFGGCCSQALNEISVAALPEG
jgi:hypothetical protein